MVYRGFLSTESSSPVFQASSNKVLRTTALVSREWGLRPHDNLDGPGYRGVELKLRFNSTTIWSCLMSRYSFFLHPSAVSTTDTLFQLLYSFLLHCTEQCPILSSSGSFLYFSKTLTSLQFFFRYFLLYL